MRVNPSPAVAVAVAVGYMVVFGLMVAVSGVDYDDLAATADNALKAIVIPLAVSAVYLIVVTTFLGWWKAALREERRLRGWPGIVPVVILLGVVAGINYGHLGELDSQLIIWLAVGALLVGFSEELAYRGLALIGFRGTGSEVLAWFWSSAMFGLLHGLNFLLGQDLGPTLQQLVFAFLLGSGFYIARRVSGVIFLPMILHTVWDFSSFTSDGNALGVVSQNITLLVIIITLVSGRHLLFAPVGQEAPITEGATR